MADEYTRKFVQYNEKLVDYINSHSLKLDEHQKKIHQRTMAMSMLFFQTDLLFCSYNNFIFF
jgi:hypothetical protein